MEKKITYLQMIQEPICRMSTNSTILKGFAASIVSGISLISYSSINLIVLGLSFLPVLLFAVLDLYFLKQERGFRYLYEQVRGDKHDIDFSMEIRIEKADKRLSKTRIIDCIKSPSIWMFYPALILILGVVLILKCQCQI